MHIYIYICMRHTRKMEVSQLMPVYFIWARELSHDLCGTPRIVHLEKTHKLANTHTHEPLKTLFSTKSKDVCVMALIPPLIYTCIVAILRPALAHVPRHDGQGLALLLSVRGWRNSVRIDQQHNGTAMPHGLGRRQIHISYTGISMYTYKYVYIYIFIYIYACICIQLHQYICV